MERTYTLETRIYLNEEIKRYLSSYVRDYNRLYRVMWHQTTSPTFAMKPSSYITYICNKYGVLRRTANTIYKSIQGRRRALIELKKLELTNTKHKSARYAMVIEKLKNDINSLKPKVTLNRATDAELQRYRRLKQALYQKQRKYNRLKQR